MSWRHVSSPNTHFFLCYIWIESTAISDTNSINMHVILDEEESTQQIVLHLVDDNVVEVSEVIQVKLSIVGESVGIELIDDTATIIISDDDGQLPCIEYYSVIITFISTSFFRSSNKV